MGIVQYQALLCNFPPCRGKQHVCAKPSCSCRSTCALPPGGVGWCWVCGERGCECPVVGRLGAGRGGGLLEGSCLACGQDGAPSRAVLTTLCSPRYTGHVVTPLRRAAVGTTQSALRLRPGFSDAYNNMATALLHKGLVLQAMECYNSALALNPALVRAALRCATFLLWGATAICRHAPGRRACGLGGGRVGDMGSKPVTCPCAHSLPAAPRMCWPSRGSTLPPCGESPPPCAGGRAHQPGGPVACARRGRAALSAGLLHRGAAPRRRLRARLAGSGGLPQGGRRPRPGGHLLPGAGSGAAWGAWGVGWGEAGLAAWLEWQLVQ